MKIRMHSMLRSLGLVLAAAALTAGLSTAPTARADDLNFTGTTLSGAGFNGASLQGKPAVLWFWTPWCPFCNQEAPNVSAVAAANQAARIIAVSHGIADSLRAQGVEPARIRVVPNGIDPTQPLPDPAACRARLGVSADTVVIGTVCSLLPRKGVADLLTAVARLQSATPPASTPSATTTP